MNKRLKIPAVLTLLIIAAYVTLLFIKPAAIIWKTLSIKFNNPGRVDTAVYKDFMFLIVAGVIISTLLWLMESKYWKILVSLAVSFLKKASSIFTSNVLLGISLIYLFILFFIAITHYDLGFDEAWYIYWAKTFASTGIPSYTYNGKTGLIDNITMLPYYLISVINFKTGLTDVVYFKILSSILSGLSLITFFRTASRFYDKTVAIIALFVLIAQPGFGFIASSFFGELLAIALLFLGLYFWLKDPPPYKNKTIYIAALFFSIAISTKFQLVMILPVTLLIFHYTDRNTNPMKILLYTVIFTLSFIIIRSIPAVISDPKLIRNLLGTAFFQNTFPQQLFLFDKFQLLNRFFPFSVLLISLGFFFFYMKNPFERFLFSFTSITFLWWIFLYPYSTYRNPFMGLIPLSIIIAILLVRFFDAVETKKPLAVKYIAAIVAAFCMAYGFSANIIYAYVGYNDGVQFDLDGYRSRLFVPVARDNSQKDFYNELGRLVSAGDTLYNASFVTQFYLDNAVADLPMLRESIRTNPERKFLLITRERYPLDMEKGRQILDSLHATYQLGLKNGDNEMYIINK